MFYDRVERLWERLLINKFTMSELKSWKELTLKQKIDKSYDNLKRATISGDDEQIVKWRGALRSYLYQQYESERFNQLQDKLDIGENRNDEDLPVIQ